MEARPRGFPQGLTAPRALGARRGSCQGRVSGRLLGDRRQAGQKVRPPSDPHSPRASPACVCPPRLFVCPHTSRRRRWALSHCLRPLLAPSSDAGRSWGGADGSLLLLDKIWDTRFPVLCGILPGAPLAQGGGPCRKAEGFWLILGSRLEPPF